MRCFCTSSDLPPEKCCSRWSGPGGPGNLHGNFLVLTPNPLQLRDLQLRDLQCGNQRIAREQTYWKGRESGSPSQEDRETTRVTRAATRGRDRTGMESWSKIGSLLGIARSVPHWQSQSQQRSAHHRSRLSKHHSMLTSRHGNPNLSVIDPVLSRNTGTSNFAKCCLHENPHAFPTRNPFVTCSSSSPISTMRFQTNFFFSNSNLIGKSLSTQRIETFHGTTASSTPCVLSSQPVGGGPAKGNFLGKRFLGSSSIGPIKMRKNPRASN